MKTPLVSIIVLNYNGKPHLKECFSSIRKINYPKNRYEVIMGDNNSRDDSVAYVRKNFPWVRVLKLDKNYGFAEGNNKCVEHAKGKYVVFLNNDTKVDKNWLIELVKGFDYDEKIAVCGSKLLFYGKPNIINSAGGKMTWIGAGYNIGYKEKDQEKFNKLNFCGNVCGASLIIRKDIFKKLGKFDSDYFAYCEDTDLCWRAWLYGHKVLYVPDSIVYHKLGGSFGQKENFNLKICLVQKNRLANIVKNFESQNILKGLCISAAYDLSRAIKFLLSKKPQNVLPIFRGNILFCKSLNRLMQKRKEIQKRKVLSDSSLWKFNVFASLFESLKEEKKYSF